MDGRKGSYFSVFRERSFYIDLRFGKCKTELQG